MAVIIFILVFICVVFLNIVLFKYLEKCRQLRHRLTEMGVPGAKLSFSFRGFCLPYLQDMLYEKETEAAEQCFITTDRYPN